MSRAALSCGMPDATENLVTLVETLRPKKQSSQKS